MKKEIFVALLTSFLCLICNVYSDGWLRFKTGEEIWEEIWESGDVFCGSDTEPNKNDSHCCVEQSSTCVKTSNSRTCPNAQWVPESDKCYGHCYYDYKGHVACPNRKDTSCKLLSDICDGTQIGSQCGGAKCSSSREDFGFYNPSKNQCKDPSSGNPATYSCKERHGAKYVNSQCVKPGKDRQEFICLNRIDIDEKEIGNTPVFADIPLKRINHFEYFNDQNKTHIICGEKGLEKQCATSQGVFCQNRNKTNERFITSDSVCTDIDFMESMKYGTNLIEESKKLTSHSPSIDSSECENNGFYCRISDQCLYFKTSAQHLFDGGFNGDSGARSSNISSAKNQDASFACDGRWQCADGSDETFDICKSNNAFPKEAKVHCNEAFRPLDKPVEILAIRCNGKQECQNNEDEIYCDIHLKWLLVVLDVGFNIISLNAFSILCCQRLDFSIKTD